MLSVFRSIVVPLVNRNAYTSIRTYRRRGRKPTDLAGIRTQLKAYGDLKELEEDPEATYDADFTKLDKSYDLYKSEMDLKREQLKYHVIKQKYFKSKKQPNFLTWAEKEQIRNLNKQDPDEWPPERLAQSFPAIKEAIVKIIKANWRPADAKSAQAHDERVRNNWERFNANEIPDLDPEVREHLKKFSKRNFDSIQNAYAQTYKDLHKFEFPIPKSNEFSHIISSCKRINEKKIEIANENPKPQLEQKQTLLGASSDENLVLKVPEHKRKKIVTFDEIKDVNEASENEEMHLSVSYRDPNEIPLDRGKQPNFLTWAEKEQIRRLNKEDPNEWTPKRLAEKFPAIESIIVKVVKAKWTLANPKRLQKHDETVHKNWELFNSNQMTDLDPDVYNHLYKFSKRNLNSVEQEDIQTSDRLEFESNKRIEENDLVHNEKSSAVTHKQSNNAGEVVSVDNSSAENGVVDLTPSSSKIIQKYSTKTVRLTTTSKNVLPPFQHKIQIPRRLRRRGSTYKLYDCFYNERGIFLYRVPGLVD